MDNDHYHNILSEEFPSPIRNHDQLPGLPIDEDHPSQDSGVHGVEPAQAGEEGNDPSVLASNIQSIPDIAGAELLNQDHNVDDDQHEHIAPDDGGDHNGRDDHGHDDHEMGQFQQGNQSGHEDMTDRRRIGVKWSTLTNEEKKERQRAQNRRAAERSRQKKKEEV